MNTTYNPGSTYRIQFHKDFDLAALDGIIPYLESLGIRTLYASPVFEAVPGSTHGYDGINPLRINPEIGTEEQLRRVSKRLHDAGIGWLQDFVPNHMAFDPGNAWLMDVLREGPASRYASYFDIEAGERLMVPVLGDSLEHVIRRGELKLVNERGHHLEYGGVRYPLRSGAYPEAPDAAALGRIADSQHYRLCHWQETDQKINYRRFFTVNGLICLNIQHEHVFTNVHGLVARLLKDGVFDGLRIDHIDGLYDPTEYLERLRALCGPDAYIVVEKILQPEEPLPARWPVQGTTGYDFLGLVNNLLTEKQAVAALTRFYQRFTGDTDSPERQAHRKKAHILERHMQGELNNLTRLAGELLPETGEADLREAIAAFLIHCPVYRYYGASWPVTANEAAELDKVFGNLDRGHSGVKALRSLILDSSPISSSKRSAQLAHFYRRLMQYSGPLMAKGVEDTLMYTYGRFIAHNEVGDAPEAFGISVETFHKAMLERRRAWPLAQNVTSTHDTKRGEDARAILNVLPQVPEQWSDAVRAWSRIATAMRPEAGPDRQDEYFIYQTLFATYPISAQERHAYPDRLGEYLRKALREGKRHSDWAAPDEAYETATVQFAQDLIRSGSPFLAAFRQFREPLLEGGMLLALTQLSLKLLCPGVPDIYQGTELWDLSMVDPDNRRPVDYERRREMAGSGLTIGDWKDLWASRDDGRVKLTLLRELLQLRAAHRQLFAAGQYLPLQATGKLGRKLIAFARHYKEDWIILASPIGLNLNGKPFNHDDWGDTRIILPGHVPADWTALDGGKHQPDGATLFAKDIFSKTPIAILIGKTAEKNRSAGVLMAITSLPGPYAIGDLGTEAKRFARSLAKSGQRIWQLLPLTPVDSGAGFSPYSSTSTMAGNTLLIAAEGLMEAGLLERGELSYFETPPTDSVDYEQAVRQKEAILDLAYSRYNGGKFTALEARVDSFYQQEKAWLDDFALFRIIRSEQGNKPWYEWPVALRSSRSSDAQRMRQEHADAMRRIVWEQAIFSMQWRELRSYCNSMGIQLLGDLPFYLSYDSADVWANQQLFSLDEDGRMTGVAGVPPDYFSETGQLWGMPTFNWRRHREQDYGWWIGRLRRNLELYDLLRIDHFRALAEYWEVPAGEQTAVRGKWLPGPGIDFFDAVRDALGQTPFVAEDLGDNMEKVYELRDAVNLPGMKVAQFAFGENLPQSVDAPHNYPAGSVCYTGTHDNNTTLGWFRSECSTEDRARLTFYMNRQPTESTINELMAKLVYGSVSERAILPMQDVLNLDERHRMNTPSSGDGNWRWRMLPAAFDRKTADRLLKLAQVYNRI